MQEKQKSLSAIGFPRYSITKSGKVYSHRNKIFLKTSQRPFGPAGKYVTLCHDGYQQVYRVEYLRKMFFPTFWEKVQLLLKNISG